MLNSLKLITYCLLSLVVTTGKASQDLRSDLLQEAEQHVLLTYKQHFLDEDGFPASYEGTVFGQISHVSLDECNLHVDVRLQDRYTGRDFKRSGRQWREETLQPDASDYYDSYLIEAKSLTSSHITVLTARPLTIQSSTGFICEESRSCEWTWVNIESSLPAFHVTRGKDGFLVADSQTNRVDIPMTSHAEGLKLVEDLSLWAAHCHVESGSTGHP